MAITIDDFSKIWGSTSSVPTYTFSDTDYKNGWEFVGNLPPTRAMWDELQRKNDEKMSFLADNILGDASYQGQQEITAAINNITLNLLQGTAPVFSNVASMKQADLVAGNAAVTKGYYAVNDGGAGLYTIRAKTAEDVIDEGSIIQIGDADNPVVAELITVNGIISPAQWGGANDVERVQNCVDYAIAHGYPNIVIDREYDLTGGTIYIDKGTKITDDVSAYSRNTLCFVGTGKAMFKKEDTGFMFSSNHGRSRDISFDCIKFRGYSTSNLPVDCIDVKCFDAERLIDIRVTNCVFTWFRAVYYQDNDAAHTSQGIMSMGNLYAKNYYVGYIRQAYGINLINDVLEDGVQAILSEATSPTDSVVRTMECISTTFEGFAGTAIEIKGATFGVNINCCYFEANKNHISIPYLFDGTLIGNAFFGRGMLSQTDALKCIEIPLVRDKYTVANNVSYEENANTTLLYINTLSPYHSAASVVMGSNATTSPTVLTNVPSQVIQTYELSLLVSELNATANGDLTTMLKNTYVDGGGNSLITGGSVTYSRKFGKIKIDFSNVVISAAITGGSTTGQSYLVPIDNSQHLSVIADYSTGKAGMFFVTTNGSVGIRVGSAGTYSGSITY